MLPKFLAILLVLHVGTSFAYWLVNGDCSGSIVQTAQVINGNCTPRGPDDNGIDLYELVTLSPNGTAWMLSHCMDKACKDCTLEDEGLLSPPSDCATIGIFAYLSKTDPTDDVVTLVGGQAYGDAYSFDNCSTTLVVTIQSANTCILGPPYTSQYAQFITCSPDSSKGTIVQYTDPNCASGTGFTFTPITIDKKCNPNKNEYTFCRFNKQSLAVNK